MNLHLKEENKLVKIFLTYISLYLHMPSLTVMNHFNSVADVHFSPPDGPLLSLRHSSSCQTLNMPICRLALSCSYPMSQQKAFQITRTSIFGDEKCHTHDTCVHRHSVFREELLLGNCL